MKRRRFITGAMATAIAAQLPISRAYADVLGRAGKVDTDIVAVTGAGKEITVERAVVQELADGLRGNLLLPGHPAYEQARRLRNSSINKHPSLIVQPRVAEDVRHAVDFARSNGILLAVKCGGHSHSGKSSCDRGLMIDLSLMRGARVDPNNRIAYVGGGSLLADLDQASMAMGLVTTAGTVSHTGVGGLTLGGGFGRLARKYGLTLDNVRAVDIVTADGQLRHASADENSDLYWGVRGGGGNFGVVTSFEFNLHPMDRKVIGGTVMYPLSEAKQLLEFYAEYQFAAPQDLALDASLYSLRGVGDFFGFDFCHSGSKKDAEKQLYIVRRAGKPFEDTVRAVDYVALQQSGDDGDDIRAVGSYTKSGFSRTLSPKFIDAIVNGFEPRPDCDLIFGFQHCGGAINSVAADATAFPHRDITLTPLLILGWDISRDASADVKWMKQYWTSVEPYISGFYTNDLIDETQQQVNENYLGNYQRLVSLKNKFDPTNLFRLNANVIPDKTA